MTSKRADGGADIVMTHTDIRDGSTGGYWEGRFYTNKHLWGVTPPSMDKKDIPSPPDRTVEEYERDKALGVNALPHWKPPVDKRGTS